MTRPTTEILDIIGFHPVPSEAELMEVEKLTREKCKSRKGAKSHDAIGEWIGSGASREVFALRSSPDDWVLKVQKAHSKKQYGPQNKVEVQTFLSYDEIRRWLPIIGSYDASNYSWVVSERVQFDRAAVRKALDEHASKTLTDVLCRLKVLGVDRSSLRAFEESVECFPRHLLIKDACRYAARMYDEDKNGAPLMREYKSKGYRGESLVDHLWEELRGTKPLSKTEERAAKAKRIPRDKRKHPMQINPWKTLSRFIRISHPIVIDLILTERDRSIRFRDLHEGNIGISRHEKPPNDLRLIDVGLVQRTPAGRRSTNPALVLP